VGAVRDNRDDGQSHRQQGRQDAYPFPYRIGVVPFVMNFEFGHVSIFRIIY
jgi:hypothetical protein